MTGARPGFAAALALLLGSPVALWLGARAAPLPSASITPAAAQPAPMPPPASKEPEPAEAKRPGRTPSAYCVGRMLSPLFSLAGEAERAVEEPLTASTSSAPQPGDAGSEDWLKRVDAGAAALRETLGGDAGGLRIQTLIATLPDPIDSGLYYHFETSLQALRMGLERPVDRQHAGAAFSGSYFRDRSFSPWDDREVAAAQRVRSEACRAEIPGMLLFRNSELARPAVLIVLLVGETPTSGLRMATMLNALRVAARLDPQAQATRVLGPTFSGSAYSLRIALDKFAREAGAAHDFHVVSGTASGASVPELLRREPASCQALPAPRIRYATATVPQAAVDCAYLWFLRRQLGADASGRDASGAQKLEGVATLRESGTVFGSSAASAANECAWTPELALTFPVHVSFLRDAYEDMERRGDAGRDAIARPTSLGPALSELRSPLDVDANPSPKARAALDEMLNSVLGEISRRAVRHVSIHATDIGDAIFLARKIRDVAPDVRIAFFEPDDILLHPKHRGDLIGSLVVSAYPFLGVNDFRLSGTQPRVYNGFPNAAAQGTFNAVLALRGVPPETVFEYAFEQDERAEQAGASPALAPLPVWISAIARTGLVPLKVVPPVDCTRAIYGMDRPNPGLDALCAQRAAARRGGAAKRAGGAAYQAFDQIGDSSLPIDPALELPRFWNFLYVSLIFAFAVDRTRQRRAIRGLAHDEMPARFDPSNDHSADRAIGRTKWWLYATIRSFLFVLAFGYMSTVYLLAFVAREGFAARPADLAQSLLIGAVEIGALAFAIVYSARALQTFARNFRAFAHYVDERVLPATLEEFKAGITPASIASETRPSASLSLPARITRRVSLSLGVASPVDRRTAAKVSFAQLRLVALLTFAFATLFTLLLLISSLVAADVGNSSLQAAVPTLTLNVLRNVPLLNGVSPATPALLCIVSVYVWSVGRMSRLLLAHEISLISPCDGETDLVSTPIRLVLYPDHGTMANGDEGYTRAERDLLNAIWRPITGRYYVFACLVVICLPIVLFALKPLSTLETRSGCWLLGSGLGLAAVLNGVTVVQLLQYWVRFQRLLKRTMAHELGPAFARLPEFARDSIDRQISGSANDLLRWTACARQLETLRVAIARAGVQNEDTQALASRVALVRERAQVALVKADAPDGDGTEQHALAEEIISAAATVARLIRRTREPSSLQRAVELAPAELRLAVGDDRASAPGSDREWGAHESRAALLPAPAGEVRAGHGPLLPPALAHGHIEPTPVAPAAVPLFSGIAPAYDSPASEPAWLSAAEVHVVTVVTLLIHRHVRQLRYFMSTLIVTALLLLLAVTSYPFEPYRLLLTCIWGVVGSVAGAGAWVYVQLDRNTLISVISGTPPNQMTFDSGLLMRVLTWIVIPLLCVAAAQYPSLADALYQVIAPFTRALR